VQSQSNLTIGISADTQKAREEIGKLQSSLRGFHAEQRKLADDMRKSGGGSPQQQAQYTAATRGILTTEAALRRLTAEQRVHTGVTNRESESINKLALHFGHLAHAVGLPIEGLKALKFGVGALVTGEVIRAIAGGVTQLNALNNAVRAIPGGKAAELKSLQQAVKETGQEAEIATRAYTQFNKLADEAAIRAIESGRLSTSGVNIVRGGQGPQGGSIGDIVARGGRDAVPIDWTDPFRAVTGRERTKDRTKDNIDLAKSILGIKDATLQNLATQKNYNVTFGEYEEVLKRTVAGTLPVQKPATEENKKLLADANEAAAKTTEQIEEAQQAVALGAVKAAKQSAEAFVEMGPKMTEAATLPLDNIKKAWTEADLPSFFSRIGKESADSFNQQMSTAGANLPPWMKSVGSAIAAGTTAAGEAAAGQAAGGHIRGPGTGTSDSILARLSNGEFVVNARSVSRLGVGFLNRLNRYAAGGYTGDFDSSPYDFDPTPYEYKGVSRYWISERYQATQARDQPKTAGGRGGGGGGVAGGGGGGSRETDEEYFRRTGYHYGARAEDRGLARAGELPASRDPRDIGLARRGELPVSRDPRDIGLARAGELPYSYAIGGLVGGMPPISFAEGGLVGSASGASTPVHLHLGGQVFATSASQSVASALVSEAHRQAMTSAGVKPSWFGGRPGGR
jgi:hypothetical protein